MRTRAELAFVACVSGLLGSATAAADLDKQALMQLLGSAERASARYVETRHSALLTAPLISRGTLLYERPDRLEKHVSFPYDERIVLERGQMSIDNRTRGRKMLITITRAPGIAGLVESIRATRAGDLGALERFFEVEVGGNRDEWRLRLRPHDRELAEYVNAVTVKGAGPRIERIEVDERSGDRTVMEINEELR
jgi:hypothetical protein